MGRPAVRHLLRQNAGTGADSNAINKLIKKKWKKKTESLITVSKEKKKSIIKIIQKRNIKLNWI